MTRATRNTLLGIGGILTLGLVPWLWRLANPRPARTPKLSTMLASPSTRNGKFNGDADCTELEDWRERRRA